jgi:hypothetical protein
MIMTAAGWVFLGVSLTFVASLAAWCYYRILTKKEQPAQPVKDFHSA